MCWPMYAAMPAVLKEAVERSYEDCGWNLLESTNPYEGAVQAGLGQSGCRQELYPTFADVARNIRSIIDSSEYDAENKGAYKGALVTRLKSLTNGINGLVFTADELSCEELFGRNVIVDLSRVGSTETKSLIMGLLVLKLHEHRMTEGQVNAPLRHVTVLEEAHNLLKRTSTEQSQESGNLLGKSVEMLANSIAEMRTYGQGFVIADQAPGLLDMAVIRNTNTKIVMRLPDQEDRELVGRAANLNEDQIAELVRLPLGVAAVYQNEWIEPVLCKVERFADGRKFQHTPEKPEAPAGQDDPRQKLRLAELLYSGTKLGSMEEILEKMEGLPLSASVRVQVIRLLSDPPSSPRYTKLAPVMAQLFPKAKDALALTFEKTSEPQEWTEAVDTEIRDLFPSIEQETLRDIRQCVVTQYLLNELADRDAYAEWRKAGVK